MNEPTLPIPVDEHRGKPLIRQMSWGSTVVFCPYGHVVEVIPEGEWAHSSAEARYGRPDATVACRGAVPEGVRT